MSWGGPPPGQNPYYGQPAGYGQQPAGAYNAPPPGGLPANYNPPTAAPGGYRPPAAQPGGFPQQQGGYASQPGGVPQGVPQGMPPGGVPQGVPPGVPQGVPGGYMGSTGGAYRPNAPPAGGGYASAPPHNPHYGGYGGAPPQTAGGFGGGAPAGYGAPPPSNFGAPPPQGPPPGISPELWHWFQTVDQDRSGRITAEELQQALMNGNWTPFNKETCRLMIGMFDRDKSGTIDVTEFSALWKYIQDWKNCFDRFDTDRSGNINAQELQTALQTFGYNLSVNFSQLCVRVFDRTTVQSMKFDDFIQCCVMLKSLTDKFRQKDVQQVGTIRIQYEEFLRMVMDNSIMQ